MPNEVNPFEPWRPRDSGSGGGGGEEVYPWRVPPRDEGLPEPDGREVPHYQRRGKAAPDEEGAVPTPSAANTFCVLLLIALVIGTLIASGASGGNHFYRHASLCACLWLGTFIGLSMMYRSGWLARLGVVALGVGASAACFAFVPTYGGLTWWSAREMLEAVGRMPPGDLEAFRAGQAGRDRVRHEFASWTAEVGRAEAAWVQDLAGRLPGEVDALARDDAGKALARLEDVEKALAGTPQRVPVQGPLHRAWERAIAARMAEMATAADALAGRGQYLRAHAEIQAGGDELQRRVAGHVGTGSIRDQARDLRGGLLDRQLKEGEALLERLLDEGKHEAVAREGRRLAADMGEAAAPLDRQRQVIGRIARPRAKAVRARMEVVRATAAAHIARNDPDKAAEALAEGLKGLDEEAQAAGEWAEIVGSLAPLRRSVLGQRVARSARDVEALLDKKEHEKAGAAAKAALANYAGEARTLGEYDATEEKFLALRRKAWRARLDQAREGLRALLVKDAFAEVGAAGEKAAIDLTAEGEALRLRGELDEFTARCRAIARLAAAAGKKE